MSPKGEIVPRLVIIEGKDKGKVIPLYNGTAIIGRSKGDVVVQDPRISRSHIAIHYDASTQKLSFTDLKSLNGTFVNGETSEAGELDDGDNLQLGDTTFDCQIGTIEDEETSVSKVKDRLKREKESKKKEKKEKKVEAQPDPFLIPLEPKKSDKQPPPKKKVRKQKKTVSLSGIKAIYNKIPRLARVASLSFVVIAAALIYLSDDSGKPNSKMAVEQGISSINKLLSQQRIEEALREALTLKDNYPNDSRPYMALGNLYAIQQENELAIESFIKAHQLAPDQPLVHVKLVRVLLRSGFYKEAQNELAHIDLLLREGKNRELFIESAHLFLEFKELEEPPEKTLILAKALQTELAPDSTIGYKLEAQVLFQQKRNVEALPILEKALTMDPMDEWLLENTVYARISLKDQAGAEKAVTNWIQLHPNTSKALLVMAYLKMNSNQTNASLPYLERILENGRNNPADPFVPEALFLKGQALWKVKQIKAAAALFRQSCQAGFERSCQYSNIAESLSSTVKEARIPNTTNKPTGSRLPNTVTHPDKNQPKTTKPTTKK